MGMLQISQLIVDCTRKQAMISWSNLGAAEHKSQTQEAHGQFKAHGTLGSRGRATAGQLVDPQGTLCGFRAIGFCFVQDWSVRND